MLMSGKQFKILNRKVNSLLQLQADVGGKNSVSALDVDVMLQDQEHQILDKLNHMEEPTDLRIKFQLNSFNTAIRDLKETAKSHHILFVKDMETVCENINLKVQELKEDMTKDIVALDHNYFTLHNKVDIIVGAMAKEVELYTSLGLKLDSKSEVDASSFGSVETLLQFLIPLFHHLYTLFLIPLKNFRFLILLLFVNIIQQPITTLFRSQSIEEPQFVNDDDMDGGGFMGSFSEIQFNSEYENIPDHMLMSGKQFKILNRKVNSLLQLQANVGGKNLVSALDVDVMLQDQEHQMLDKLNHMEEPADLRVKSQLISFNTAIPELKETAKSLHILFVKDVETVRENINLKVQELKEYMMKDIAALDHNYSTLHNKVDIIAGVVAKEVELYTSLGLKLDSKSEVDASSFGSVETLLEELKDIVSKVNNSKRIGSTCEICKFYANKCPTCKHNGARGERRNVSNGSGSKGKGGSGNVVGDARVVGRVLTTQIPTSLPKTPIVTSSTIATTRPITKGIVIRTAGGESSSSKPNPS
ncbi:unnamed protein product [Lactuca saligna]|uniref:Uncharacterized protein n=1 Tax=Lactuca saligna TaxID=75948 RepID=A0AA35YZV3_LACSI|nr:unnamed protein product [Lactuca saligna]